MAASEWVGMLLGCRAAHTAAAGNPASLVLVPQERTGRELGLAPALGVQHTAALGLAACLSSAALQQGLPKALAQGPGLHAFPGRPAPPVAPRCRQEEGTWSCQSTMRQELPTADAQEAGSLREKRGGQDAGVCRRHLDVGGL